MKSDSIFERTEKKYIITLKQKDELLKQLDKKIIDDEYGQSTIKTLYFDTADFRLIRKSIEKPVYKEKLRLRCYNTPTDTSIVFLELKKKYRGVVYKRREKLKYAEVKSYLKTLLMPKDTQIMREIDYTMHYYPDLQPRICIIYDRCAYYSSDDASLRITFDSNLRFRTTDLTLASDVSGEKIISDEYCIMEIKALGGIPLWLTKVLTDNKIYPGSFSKYGTAYKIISNSDKNGGSDCA